MTRHSGHDARFARFFRRAGVACASEDCSGRSPADITRSARMLHRGAHAVGLTVSARKVEWQMMADEDD